MISQPPEKFSRFRGWPKEIIWSRLGFHADWNDILSSVYRGPVVGSPEALILFGSAARYLSKPVPKRFLLWKYTKWVPTSSRKPHDIDIMVVTGSCSGVWKQAKDPVSLYSGRDYGCAYGVNRQSAWSISQEHTGTTWTSRNNSNGLDLFLIGADNFKKSLLEGESTPVNIFMEGIVLWGKPPECLEHLPRAHWHHRDCIIDWSIQRKRYEFVQTQVEP